MMAAAVQGSKSEMTAFANSAALGEAKPSLPPSRRQLYPGPMSEAETAEPAAQAVHVHRTVKRSLNLQLRSKLPRNLQGCIRIA